MMRSMYSGVSGLKTHQTKMDVIGNNIANVNTVAFKSSSVTFQDLMYQTTQNATGADAATGRGGVNATQIGLGVKLGAVYTDIGSQGSLQSTNNAFDMAITGENFFIVNNGVQNCYTRAGNFYVDGGGNLAMKTTGYLVQGWVADADGNLSQELTSLPIMTAENQTSEPEATTEATVSGVLDKNSAELDPEGTGRIISIQTYDSLGYTYTVQMKIKANNDSLETGQYSLQFYNILDSEGVSVPASEFFVKSKSEGVDTNPTTPNVAVSAMEPDSTTVGGGVAVPVDNSFMVTISGNATDGYVVTDGRVGKDKTFTDAAEAAEYFEKITGETPTVKGTAPNISYAATMQYIVPTTEIIFDVATGNLAMVGAASDGKDVTLNLDGIAEDAAAGTVGAGSINFKDLHIDFSSVKWLNNGGNSTIDGKAGGIVDGVPNMGAGKKLGKMTGLSVDNAGKIYAAYSNGNTKLLGQVATAGFANASGLLKSGENLYEETLNSGEASLEAVTANGGSISAGYLELSNVDLAAEFTEMITTQRGYQANSRIITTSDSMLEELVNLKR